MVRTTITCLALIGLGATAVAAMSGASLVFDRVSIPALNEVSFSVDAGEVVAFVGASGSGKTTLMRLIGLLERPTGGDVLVDGQSVSGLSAGALEDLRRRTIGLLQRASDLDGNLTVFENLEKGLLDHGLAPGETETRIDRVLRRLSLGPLARTGVDQLSGGERQRVAVARAFALEPRILIADEPTSDLDPRTSMELLQALGEIAPDATVILVTHDQALARMARARIVTLGAYRR